MASNIIKQQRAAAFYITRDDKSNDPRYAALQFSGGATVYIRGELTGFGLREALDEAKPEPGESVMNSHYVDKDAWSDGDDE